MRITGTPNFNKVGRLCPACNSSDKNKKDGILRVRVGKYGEFLGCSKFPDCKFTSPLPHTTHPR